MSSLRKTMARVHDNCHYRQSWSMSPPFQFCGKSTILHVHFTVYLALSISHFALYQHPPPDRTAMKNQKLTPAALEGKQFRWTMQEPVWQERLVFCLLFLCVMFLIHAIIYIYIYIYYFFYYIYIFLFIRF